MKMNRVIYFLSAVAATMAVFLTGCSTEENGPGYEYMPDMYRSPAIEAYVDYGMDPFHYGDSMAVAQRNTLSARKPVEGTIVFSSDPSRVNFNMPYNLPATPEGYEQSAQLVTPLKESDLVVAQGKVLYEKFCVQCHGKTGQGDGKVVTIGNHPPPGAYDGALKDLPEGKMFHTLTYGKGMMGEHASLLNKEERWKIIAYVKTLQGKKLIETTAPATADSIQ
jgi:mono/diheme cytochrome c family protein